jgi:hypothetical protein
MTKNTYNIDLDYSMNNSQDFNYDFGNIVSSGTILTSAGLNGTSWQAGAYSITTSSSPVVMNAAGRIECTGENADLVLNGKSIKNTLTAIEERLAILHPSPELEKEWEELKSLGDRYRTLEADIKEKMKVWDTLKKTEF